MAGQQSESNRFGKTEVTERPSSIKRENRKTRRGSINFKEIEKVKDVNLLETV